MIALILILLAGNINAGIIDRNSYLTNISKTKIEYITRELKDKTGIDVCFIVDKDINFDKKYVDSFIKGQEMDNKLLVFIDRSKNKIFKVQGENVSSLMPEEKVKYIIDNSLSGKILKFLPARMLATTAIIAKDIADKKDVKIYNLKGVFIKPLDSVFYRITEKFPFSIVIKLFYANPMLFISLFILFSWIILVKCSGILWGEKGGVFGNILWKICLFLVFCIIIVRVGADYNEYLAAVGVALILFLPLVIIFSAVYKDEIQVFFIKLFGWE